jgi:hypothetical protein
LLHSTICSASYLFELTRVWGVDWWWPRRRWPRRRRDFAGQPLPLPGLDWLVGPVDLCAPPIYPSVRC